MIRRYPVISAAMLAMLLAACSTFQEPTMTPEEILEINTTTRADLKALAEEGLDALESVTTDLDLQADTRKIGHTWHDCSDSAPLAFGDVPEQLSWTYRRTFVVDHAEPDDLRERAQQATDTFLATHPEWEVTRRSPTESSLRLSVDGPGRLGLEFSATAGDGYTIFAVGTHSRCMPAPQDLLTSWPNDR